MLPHVLLLAGMIIQALTVFYFARNGWFGFDGLHYLIYRGQLPEADLGLLEAWGGHWQAVVFVLYRGLFAVFQWNYAGYLGTAIALHLLVTAASYTLLLRIGAPRSAAFVAAWLLLFFGTGAEVFTSDAPIPLTLALLLVLGALWCVSGAEARRPWQVATAAALLLIAVMTSAVGVIGLVWVAGFVVGSGHWRRAAVVVPAAVAFALWYVTVGNDSPRIQLEEWDATEIPAFVWRAMTQALSGSIGVPESGALLLLLLVAALVLAPTASNELRALAWAGCAAAGVELVASALASLAFIEGPAIPPRYLYVAFALMVPAIALALGGLGQLVKSRAATRGGVVWPALMAAALVVTVTVQGLQQERSSAEFATAIAKPTREWVYGTAEAAAAGERILDPNPPVTFGEAMDMRLVAELVSRRPLPEWDDDTQARVVAENNFFVTVGPEDPELFHPIFIDGSGFTKPFRPRPGCHTYVALALSDPVLRFSTGQGNAVGVTSDSSTVTTRVIRGEIEGPTRSWSVEPGPVYVASTAKDAVVEVSFDGDGEYSVCHQ